ncbi:MAG: ribosome-associated translation inhibitor RaiA [Sedimentisphaerales bacterium]|nr:ribosome-associated translation inhibitor RaiA [Planctomycetota bacterium]MDY0357299.1 ribosome-associated translation inhibitor RaiA [Sedimentisphaerales bacterium]NLT78209.1 ribosome-associated translation inhibitor RaiA [Planctomycetota bacterium]
MDFTITGKHITITEAMKEYAQEKTSKLPRFYNTVSQVEVVVDGDQTAGKISIEIIARGEHSNVFIATEAADDAYKGIDAAVRKLEEQLRRKKTKERNNKHTGTGGGYEPA